MALRFLLLLFFLNLFHLAFCENGTINHLLKEYHLLPEHKVNDRVTKLNDIAWEYAYQDPDSALYFANMAKAITQNPNSNIEPGIEANTYGTLGIIYDISGNKKLALQNYLSSLEILEEINDAAGIATAANNIGALFHSLNGHKKALKYFNTSYEKEMSLQDTLAALGSLINLAVCHKNLDNIKESKKILYHSLELCKTYSDTMRYGQIYNNLGALYLEENTLDSAHYYFEKGVQFNSYSGNYYNVAIAYENLARIHLLKKDLINSKKNIIKALKKAEDGEFYTLLVNSYETAFEVYLYERNIDSAYHYKYLMETIKDSVQNKDQKKIIDELETKYNLTELEKKVLKKDLEIAESKNTNLMYLIAIIAAGVILLIVLLFALMKINSNKKLKGKNIIIQNALEEKEILMREVHHRVKNNMQSIKSIVNIQKRKSNNPEVIENLNHTLNRINAMTIIHQRLYKQDNLSDISTPTYFKELIEEAVKVYNFKEKELELHLDVEQAEVEVDRLFNIGLVINELVTNSCKYGISDDGVLRITFTMREKEDLLLLQFSDQGSQGTHPESKKSVGSTLIQAIIRKLNGKIDYLSNEGWIVELIIPND